MLKDIFTMIGLTTVSVILVLIPEIRLCVIERKVGNLEATVEELQSQINDNVDRVKKESLEAGNS